MTDAEAETMMLTLERYCPNSSWIVRDGEEPDFVIRSLHSAFKRISAEQGEAVVSRVIGTKGMGKSVSIADIRKVLDPVIHQSDAMDRNRQGTPTTAATEGGEPLRSDEWYRQEAERSRERAREDWQAICAAHPDQDARHEYMLGVCDTMPDPRGGRLNPAFMRGMWQRNNSGSAASFGDSIAQSGRRVILREAATRLETV